MIKSRLLLIALGIFTTIQYCVAQDSAKTCLTGPEMDYYFMRNNEVIKYKRLYVDADSTIQDLGIQIIRLKALRDAALTKVEKYKAVADSQMVVNAEKEKANAKLRGQKKRGKILSWIQTPFTIIGVLRIVVLTLM